MNNSAQSCNRPAPSSTITHPLPHQSHDLPSINSTLLDRFSSPLRIALLIGCWLVLFTTDFFVTNLIAQQPTATTKEVSSDAKKQILLLGQSPDGHPETTHEYMAGQRILSEMLAPYEEVEVKIVRADDPWPEGPESLQDVDVVVLFLSEGAKWLNANPRRYQAFAKLAHEKKGLVCLHWAMGTKEADNVAPFVRLFGACHGGPDRSHGIFETGMKPTTKDHPITNGLESIRIKEEFYYALKRTDDDGLVSLVTASIEGKDEMVAWAWNRPDQGKSFGFTGLHYHDNWKQPVYRRLVLQGVLWTAGVEIKEEGEPIELANEVYELKTNSK